MRTAIVTVVLTGALVGAAPALAATEDAAPVRDTATSETKPAKTVSKTKKTAIAKAPTPTIRLTLERAIGGSDPLAATGSRVVIRGSVSPYRPGQDVTVRVYQGDKKVYVKAMAVQKVKGADRGGFVLGYTPSGAGSLRIRASHRKTDDLGTGVAKSVKLTAVEPTVTIGQRGPAVRLLQRMLAAKGYVVGERGVYDERTARAVMAFRKLTNMDRNELATQEVFERLLDGQGAFKVRYPDHGHHVEGDLTHQVMALIDHGKVQRIYPISSGKPSTPTVLGNFHVYYKTPGINAKGMVYSSYFIRGYAVHGYAEVPTYAASHGCLRTPVPDAISIYDWIKMGDAVDVYYRDQKTPAKVAIDPDAGP